MSWPGYVVIGCMILVALITVYAVLYVAHDAEEQEQKYRRERMKK